MKHILIILSLLVLSSCFGSKYKDVKSPCVSLEDGPCGKKRPVNTWLDKQKV